MLTDRSPVVCSFVQSSARDTQGSGANAGPSRGTYNQDVFERDEAWVEAQKLDPITAVSEDATDLPS